MGRIRITYQVPVTDSKTEMDGTELGKQSDIRTAEHRPFTGSHVVPLETKGSVTSEPYDNLPLSQSRALSKDNIPPFFIPTPLMFGCGSTVFTNKENMNGTQLDSVLKAALNKGLRQPLSGGNIIQPLQTRTITQHLQVVGSKVISDHLTCKKEWVCFSETESEEPTNQFADTLKSNKSLATDADFVRNLENEELFEIDMHIEGYSSIIRSLRVIMARMSGMAPAELETFVNPDISGDTRRAFNRVYGDDTPAMIEKIMKWPFISIPIVLRRMEAKKMESENYRCNLPNCKEERTKWLRLNLNKSPKYSKVNF